MNKYVKKSIAFILASTLIFSMSACTSAENVDSSMQEDETSEFKEENN